MKTPYWIGIAAAALLVGALIGYGLWGPEAARLPEVEKELGSLRTQMEQTRKDVANLKSNLGEVTNQKLNLEKENTELKEALEKASKRRR